MSSPETSPSQRVTLATNPEQPVTVTATVVKVEHREDTGILGPRIGLDAWLDVTFPGDHHPHTHNLSRLVDEPCWLLDAYFSPAGLPGISHGFGAREVNKQGIVPELEALLDQAALQHGLASAIGPGVPLVLANHHVSEATSDD